MKKIKLIIISLFAVLFSTVFYSCIEDGVVEDEIPVLHSLYIASSDQVIPQAGGSASITFTSTDSWVVTTGANWISISQSNGKAGNVTITVTASENDLYDERNGNVTITAGSITKNVTITQKQKDALLVSSNKIEVKTEGGDANIEVKTNVNYEVKLDDSCKDWISIVSTRALSTCNVTLKISENKEITSREGKISIVSGNLKEDVSIYQSGTTPSIVISQKEYTVSSEGNTIKVELQSNTQYSVQMPGVDWISESTTRAMSSYTHYFNVSANEGYDSRSAKIIFKDNEYNVSDTVKIIQAQKDAILIADSEYRIKSVSQYLDFEIQSNIDFTVEVSADWIKQVKTRSLSTTKLYFNIDENAGYDPRDGYIQIKANDIKQIIKVTQEGADDLPFVRFSAAEDQILRTSKEIDGMEYSVGNGKWSTLGSVMVSFGGSLGDLRLRNKNVNGTSTGADETESATFIFYNEPSVSCSGDIRTLIDYENYSTVSTASARFCHLFENCTQLTSAPSLPATNIASSCYYKMFSGCKNLAIAPELPATWLDKECYYGMFSDCSKLTTAPNLPAASLDEGCYCNMFSGCSSLTTAPDLLATTLATSCYSNMFRNCSDLVSAPNLPATTLAVSCYYNMFRNCTSLETAPELPATTLANSCYYNMFCNCISLIKAPELPATTLVEFCYSNMFQDCISLTEAPVLAATKLEQSCYYEMFRGCSKINHIKMLATDISASNCLENWTYGVSKTGTFIKSVDATWNNDGVVPEGWTVKNVTSEGGEIGDIPYVTFSADAEQTLTMTKAVETLEYSVNGSAWTTLGTTTVTFGGAKGDLRLKGKSSTGTFISMFINKWDEWEADYSKIIFGNNTKVQCSGDIRTLVDYENYSTADCSKAIFYCLFRDCNQLTTPPDLPITTLAISDWSYHFGCYALMFSGCTSLRTAPKLPATTLADGCYYSMFNGCSALTMAPELPATTLVYYCYNNMFSGCTNLSSAPDLPAVSLASGCYDNMFGGCTSLLTAPELPATTLSNSCYTNMFSGCTSLTTAPKLPATSLTSSCYTNMFRGCTSLTTAPKLPATSLAERCYRGMFDGCTSLTSVPELPATSLVLSCYEYMFLGCSGLINAPDLPATTIANSCYYGMFQNCSNLKKAPKLPATSLKQSCYESMFEGCKNLTKAPDLLAKTLDGWSYFAMFRDCSQLNHIRMLATDVTADESMHFWTSGVATTGIFIKNLEAIWNSTGASGVPEGWTVIYFDSESGKYYKDQEKSQECDESGNSI